MSSVERHIRKQVKRSLRDAGGLLSNPLSVALPFVGSTAIADRGLRGVGIKNTPTAAYEKGEIAEAEQKAKADAEAAYRQALFEASKQEGLARLALRRRRGYSASMIVGPAARGPHLGSSDFLGSGGSPNGR